MTNPSNRSKPRLKARFPRLALLFRKRKEQDPNQDWFATADGEGNVQIHPRNRTAGNNA